MTISNELKQELIKRKNEEPLETLVTVAATKILEAKKAGVFLKEEDKHMLKLIFLQKGNRVKDIRYNGEIGVDAILAKLSSYPLVRNEDGKVSAKKSFEAITNKMYQSMLIVLSYHRTRTNFYVTAKEVVKIPKHVCVPLWAMAHKRWNGVKYEEWSLAEEDNPTLAFGAMLTDGIIHMKNGLLDKVEPYLGNIREEMITNTEAKDIEMGSKRTRIGGGYHPAFTGVGKFERKGDLELNNFVIQIATQTGFMDPTISDFQISNNEYAIRNFRDLDAPAEPLKRSKNMPAITVDKMITGGDMGKEGESFTAAEWGF